MTVADVCAAYLAEVTPTKAVSTQRHDRLYAKIVSGALGDRPIAHLSTAEVDAFHRTLGARGRVLANRVLSFISQVCDLAERRGLRGSNTNPTRAIRRNTELRRTKYLRADQRRRLVAAVRACTMAGEISVSAGTLLLLMLLVGLRWSEVRELRWTEVDLEAGLIRLAARGDGRDEQKGGDERVVPLSDPAIAVLRSLPRWSTWVAPNRSTRRPYKDLRKAIARVEQRSGLAFTPHVLRHSYGTACAEAGLSAAEIGACLGHRSSATSNRYVHLAGQAARRAAQRAAAFAAGGDWT